MARKTLRKAKALTSTRVLVGSKKFNVVEARGLLRALDKKFKLKMFANVSCPVRELMQDGQVKSTLSKWDENEQSYLFKQAVLMLDGDVAGGLLMALRRRLKERCGIYASVSARLENMSDKTKAAYIPRQK